MEKWRKEVKTEKQKNRKTEKQKNTKTERAEFVNVKNCSRKKFLLQH
jgi:hypothetical protein